MKKTALGLACLLFLRATTARADDLPPVRVVPSIPWSAIAPPRVTTSALAPMPIRTTERGEAFVYAGILAVGGLVVGGVGTSELTQPVSRDDNEGAKHREGTAFLVTGIVMLVVAGGLACWYAAKR